MDMKNRRLMADAIEAYLEHRIDSFALDDALTKLQETADRACRAIAGEMWFQYDDCSRHWNEGKRKFPPGVEQVGRWLVLLRSDREWNWTDKSQTPSKRGFRGWLRRFTTAIRDSALAANEFWPWTSEQDGLGWLEEERNSHES